MFRLLSPLKLWQLDAGCNSPLSWVDDLSEVSALIFDTKRLARQFQAFRIDYISRSGIKVAHVLASERFSLTVGHAWIEDAPSHILALVDEASPRSSWLLIASFSVGRVLEVLLTGLAPLYLAAEVLFFCIFLQHFFSTLDICLFVSLLSFVGLFRLFY
ncbi:hypothetical protein GQ457_12G028870 [Hibiscus cannabinus]